MTIASPDAKESRPNLAMALDTGGLMQSHAPTIDAYSSHKALIDGESSGGAKTPSVRLRRLAVHTRVDAVYVSHRGKSPLEN